MVIESEINKAISAYEIYGIVTRNDCASIDSRPLAKEIFEEMQKRGYLEVDLSEGHLKGYSDYSQVIFNPERYDYEQAIEYLVKNVLYSE